MKLKIIVIVFITGMLTLSSCRSTSKPCGLAENPTNTFQKTSSSLYTFITTQVS